MKTVERLEEVLASTEAQVGSLIRQRDHEWDSAIEAAIKVIEDTGIQLTQIQMLGRGALVARIRELKRQK